MQESARYSKLAEITKLINSKLDLRKALEQVVIAISEEIVQCSSVGIFLAQSDGTFRGYAGKPDVINGITLDQLIVDPKEDLFVRELIETRKSIYIPNTARDNRPNPRQVELFQIKSLLGVPICYEDNLYGLFTLFDYGVPMNLTTAEIQTVEAYVNMAAVAIRNANLFSQQRNLLSEKQLLLDATRELSLCLTTQEVLDTCFHFVGEALENRNILVHLMDVPGKKLSSATPKSNGDWVKADWTKMKDALTAYFEQATVFNEVIRSKKLLLIPNIAADHRLNNNGWKDFGIQGLFILPMIAMGEVLGVIVILSMGKVRTYQEAELQLAQSIVEATATALSNILRREKLEEMVSLRTAELREKNDNLRETKELFFQAFNASPTINYIVSLENWEYIYANDSFVRFTGYNRDEVIGKSIYTFNFFLNDVDRLREIITSSEHGRNLEMNYKTKRGVLRNALFSCQRINFFGKSCALVVANDITEIRSLRSQVSRLDRLSLVGEMAASLSHEIRNPMTTVKGFLQLLSGREIHNSEIYNLMIDEMDRANAIISELLLMAKDKVVKKRNANLNEIVKAIYPLIQAEAIITDKNVNLQLEAVPDFFQDESEIRQLILNLSKNGLEAMNNGGSLYIRTCKNGTSVILEIQDEGHGIDDLVIDKIGTPFVTTRDTGTGLGLAVCYSIASRHDANITVETGPTGTKFKVIFDLLTL